MINFSVYNVNFLPDIKFILDNLSIIDSVIYSPFESLLAIYYVLRY